MKRIMLLALSLAAFLWAPGLAQAEESATSSKSEKVYGVSFRLVQDGKTKATPSWAARNQQEGEIIVARTFFFPTSFDLPKVDGRAKLKDLPNGELLVDVLPNVKTNQEHVVPLFPTEFENIYTGISIPFRVDEVEPGLIRVTGKIVENALQEMSETTIVGERTGKIYGLDHLGNKTVLNENVTKIPSYSTFTSPFQVFAKLGKTYEMKLPLSGGETSVFVEVTEL